MKVRGFTLIELSVVLVIIGLLVGGVLTGRDLIRASEMRATVTQIEKYNQAVNTFRDKFGALPGDINGNTALQFGLTGIGMRYNVWPNYTKGWAGMGDANGVIEGTTNTAYNGGNGGLTQMSGETALFWADLLQSHLISDALSCYTASPPAAIGQNNCLYVFSGGTGYGGSGGAGGFQGAGGGDGSNYFALSTVISQIYCSGCITSKEGLTVNQAYAIDSKVDDGLPQSGRVTAQFPSTLSSQPLYILRWAGTGGGYSASYTTANAGSSTTCFDNSATVSGTPGVAGAPQHYSVEMSGGNNVNCALSFRFQ